MDSQAAEKEQSVHWVWLLPIIKSGEQKNLSPVWNSAEDSSEWEKAFGLNFVGGGKVT